MAHPYKIHQKAHEEYLDAYEWYEMKQDGLGDKFMAAVEKRLVHISNNPEYYSIFVGRYRQVKVDGFPFVVVYEYFPRLKRIHIAAISHYKRNPKFRIRKDQI